MTRTLNPASFHRPSGAGRARAFLAPLLLGCAAALHAQDAGGAAAPVYEKKTFLLYTVNNLGYTDVCG
jgi:hypothetical protein